MEFKFVKAIGFLIGIFILFAVPLQAQDEDRGVAVMTYLWGAGLDGIIAANGHSVEIDAGFGDVLDHLEFGFAGGMRTWKGRWAVTGDLSYIGLGAAPQTVRGNTVEVDVDMWMIGGDVAYQVAESVEILGGARIVSLENKLQFQGPLQLPAQADKTWVDPVVGLRFAPRLSENWSLWTRVDFGGFDVGSDFTWQINANVIWELTDNVALNIGYRVIDMKYDDAEGDEGFVYDATSHGPITGLVFMF